MRLAVVSDIHGNLPALEAVCRQINRLGAEQVINLGDMVSGPLWPRATLERLMALGWPAIAGNHERQLLAPPPAALSAADAHAARALNAPHRAWLAALPATRWVELPDELAHAPPLWACHASPASDLKPLLETVTPDLGQHGSPGVRAASAAELARRLDGRLPRHPLTGRLPAVLLCGHSHVPRTVLHPLADDDGPQPLLVVNPGSVGQPAFDDDLPHPHRVETGSPLARWALLSLDRRQPEAGWQVQLIATPYDHESAAQQAEANGRGDWADVLRSGRVGRLERDILGRAA